MTERCDLCERETTTLTELWYGGRVLRVCAECRKKLMGRANRRREG